jgi:vacuolar protein sorting-associated protein 54
MSATNTNTASEIPRSAEEVEAAAAADSVPNSEPVLVQDAIARRRATALAQAASVLDAVGGSAQLDGLNLLGVVANPRLARGMIVSPATSTASPALADAFHGRYTSNSGSGGASSALQHGTSAAVAANHVASPHNSAASSSDYLTDTYNSIELTLSQVTEQMDVWNQYLEDFSRQMLQDEYDPESTVPESVLQVLPARLQDLELQSLQTYLETCGPLAQNLQQRQDQRRQDQAVAASVTAGLGLASFATTAAAAIAVTTAATATTDDEMESYDEPDEIPAIFWRDDFDLTDPDTFAQLLLSSPAILQQQQSADRKSSNSKSSSMLERALKEDASVQEWFPLVSPDAFGGSLDKVEMALLQQVRSKSGAFFEESLRFAQLQEWIQSLLQQVTQVQETTDRLYKDLLQPVNTIAASDEQRAELKRLLQVIDQADTMLRCKSSIAGFLSAQDDLTAIEQIQYGRRLLAGTADDAVDAQVDVSTDTGTDVSVTAAPDAGVELYRLQALRTVSEQLKQYEQLVVTNLREELVEIFLEWNTAAVSSLYATASNGSSTPTSIANNKLHVHQRVNEIVGALKKCHGLGPTRQAYGNRLMDTIRMTVRTTVGEFASDANGTESSNGPSVSITVGATAMSLEHFLDCLDMLFEQLLALLTSASGVDDFCVTQGFCFLDDVADDAAPADGKELKRAVSTDSSGAPTTPIAVVVTAAAELSSKSISELLRIRKDAHSLVTLEEMKKIWDNCVAFIQQIEALSGHKATAFRFTLLAQTKAFVERKHESNMSALVAALDSERWTQCEVSAERQESLTRLCSGRAVLSSPKAREVGSSSGMGSTEKKAPDAEVEGIRYKTVWSCLLLLEMVMNNIATAAHFQSLASNIISKMSELLRLFNSRTTHLVLGAGAIHSTARLKSINAKHLSLVTQCLGMVIAAFPHIRAALMAQMPPKQHTLLLSLDQIKREFADHNEKVLNKFVTIIGGIVEHGLAPKIGGTNFDARAKTIPPVNGVVTCCVFVEGVSTNTRKMHQVLTSLLPPDHLQDVFSRIFAFVDQKVPSIFVAAADGTLPTKVTPKKGAAASPNNSGTRVAIPTFSFPKTDEGKERMLIEVDIMTEKLNGLEGVQPWDFTAVNVLEKKLEYRLNGGDVAMENVNSTEVESNIVATTETSAEYGAVDTEAEIAAENGAVDTEAETSAENEAVDTAEIPIEKGAADTEAETPVENGTTDTAETTLEAPAENGTFDTTVETTLETPVNSQDEIGSDMDMPSETETENGALGVVEDLTETTEVDAVENGAGSGDVPLRKDDYASESGTEVTEETGATTEPEPASPPNDTAPETHTVDNATDDDKISLSAVSVDESEVVDEAEAEPVSTESGSTGEDPNTSTIKATTL